jgi:hypothetical protein
MKLEGVDVNDHEPVTLLAPNDLLPPRNVPLDPESRPRFKLGRNGGVVGQFFEEREPAAVGAAPSRLARAARAFNDDDHARQPIDRRSA